MLFLGIFIGYCQEECMKITTHSPHIWTIEDFLTAAECDDYIAFSEAKGYNEASIITEKGTKVVKTVRNNSRIIFIDENLAERMWKRVGPFIRPIGNSVPVGLNEMFRYYKYEPGQSFKKHTDQSFIRNDVEASYYTLLIYLNDDFTGGDTRFNEIAISPAKGSALIFLHALEHSGSTVKKGMKYVLRTDIMFKLGQ